MTEPSAPNGTTSTLPPPSANGPAPARIAAARPRTAADPDHRDAHHPQAAGTHPQPRNGQSATDPPPVHPPSR